ncbi:MAG: hypothetical protein ACXW18_03905 [Pyrinomonadaceae bacterium]
MRIKILVAIFVLGLCILPIRSTERGKSASKQFTSYLYVEIETKVYRKGIEISSENPEERRWYFSNVVEQPEDVPSYSLVKQKIMPYFSRNVMDPFEARGFSLDYGEQDVKVCGETSRANYETREEAVAEREKEIEYRKGQSGNIYSFELVWGPAKGEETTKPKLIYRDKEQPSYGAAK